MFTKKFKLIATMVGLVAVLVMGLAMPGVTQQVELPTREQIVKRLSQLVAATLTAAEGDIWDFENAVFASTPSLKRTPPSVTFAYIPLHSSSHSVQLLHNWLFRDEPFGDYLNIGILYVGEDFPDCSLTVGIYHLKLRKDLKVVAFDHEGNEFVIGYAEKRQKESFPDALLASPTAPITGKLGFILALCAAGDVKMCWKEKTCRWITGPSGEQVTECHETEFCVSC